MIAHVESGAGRLKPAETTDPFISQIAVAPDDELRQRMSALASPLKSAVPATVHSGSRVAIAAPPTSCDPFMSQYARRPVLCRHSTSALPSPLKSPRPTIFHAISTACTLPPPI